ncbi:hypothetical protein FRB96_008979 [Tulasnella sp. 330]|nr:hypothetical protein FRB96_008979 [Tulasnella sp. 330]KAG8867240.1 hypothetical protein FRB97_003429 [Tulasnella sp. 331]
MSSAYQVGDKVEYHPIGGGSENTSTSTGEIMKVITSEEAAGTTGNVTHGASENEPHYLIKNDNTGKETAYKAENIVGKA